MINCSVIIAARGRYDALRRFIKSVFENAIDEKSVELIVMSDEDDPETANICRAFRDAHKWEILIHTQKRQATPNLNRDYINLGGHLSQGKYLWVIGNDAEIITKGWDAELRNTIENFVADKPDRLAYVYVSDDIHKEGEYGGCCYPAFSREHMDTLGFILPNECFGWAADHFAWIMYGKLKANRIVDNRKLQVIHYSHHTHRVERDAINMEVERISQYGADVPPEKMIEYVDRLNAVIS